MLPAPSGSPPPAAVCASSPTSSTKREAATAATRQLYAYLTALGRLQYTIYGHQNDAHHKFFRIDSGTNSDTKDMTGALAGIVGLDALSLTGEELELTDADVSGGGAVSGALGIAGGMYLYICDREI